MTDQPEVTADSLVAEQESADMRKQPKKTIEALAGLLERSGIPVDEIGRIQRVNVWQGFYKDAEGEAHTVDMTGVALVPKWSDGPEWPVVQQAKPTVIRSKVSPRRKSGVWKTAVILPDVQIGFRMFPNGELDPFHDEAAMTCALSVIRQVQPDRIINLGDFLDLPAQSRFIQEPSFAMTTQHAIDRGHSFLAEQRANAPDALIDVLEGNHDLRLPVSIMKNAAASFGLQRANLPESWPVMSVPHLLRFDDLDIQYASGYPASQIWINDNLRCIHGVRVKSRGSTAALMVDDERVSTIFGHIHRIELQHKTRQVRHGPKHNFVASPGCLCRIDGAVPSMKGGIDVLGRPIVSYEDWQQGVAVVTYREGDGPFSLELVPIHGGTAIYRGQEIAA